MNLEYLIQLLENKITTLNNARVQAENFGDVEAVSRIDGELLETEDTLGKLRFLRSVSETAETANITLEAAAADKLSAIASTAGTGYSTACMSEYDLSSYAEDPLYEQKVADLLSSIGDMGTAGRIDAYIDTEAIGSPITGSMVIEATQQYSVDARLLVAIMELESRFGTTGVGATTNNPGNIGNTGTSTQSFNSWDEGVMAVAEWLSRHRVSTEISTAAATASDQAATSTQQQEPTASNATTTTSADTATTTAASATTTPAINATTTPASATAASDTASTTPDTAATSTQDTATTTDATGSSYDSTASTTSSQGQ